MATPPLVEVRVPDLGNYQDVEVIDVLVKAGDAIEAEAPLITLETEKATMDVPSTAAGVVKEMKLERGSRVSQGDLILTLEASNTSPTSPAPAGEVARSAGEEASTSPAPAGEVARSAGEGSPTSPAPAGEVARSAGEGKPPTPRPSPAAAGYGAGDRTSVPPPAGEGARPIDEPGFSRAHASPSIRKLARELGVDLARVQGTGTKGRITDADVKAWVKRALTSSAASATGGGALPKIPAVDFAAFGPVERRPLSRIQKIAGPRLHASWVNLPHVTQFDEADITEMEQARSNLKGEATQRGIKLTPLAFVMRACVQALKEFPQFCASLDSEAGELVFKKYVHLGFAADTPNGLVVPVVRDADRKDVFELARELAELSEKARAGKLTAAEMQGACFTISSLGGIGGTAFTPIINAPEVAILGVSRSTHKPVYREGGFVPRLMLPLSLSYDHRVIDGAAAVRFTSFLAAALANVDGLLRAIP
jgi:pyruvate dehydrogenase E2 component (dihydrolipoamide acetyltransferase)